MTATDPGAFAALFGILYAAHTIGDHWVQTHHQATTKGLPGWRGRISCATHVATYTATALVGLVVLAWRTDISLDPGPVAAGLAVSAITHYIADRRTPLARLARATGSGEFWKLGGPLGGAYALDQSWHIGWIAVAALVMV